MSVGRVYVWTADAANPGGGEISLEMAPLARLEEGGRLRGRYVEVRNGGAVPGLAGGEAEAIAAAGADGNGDFLFMPGRGGARADTGRLTDERRRLRYMEAAHFAEVNTYYHVDRMAEYVHGLLAELGAPALPRVTAVVYAHNAVREIEGVRDGVKRRGEWVPMQGGHYRLPSGRYDVAEHDGISPTGEIHLGAGRRRLRAGALARRRGRPYRHNAGHNAALIYHEYGHHVSRHTADFRANVRLPAERQRNRKVALDEGTCDYWTAVMLGSPHIWGWHRRHDARVVHPRSLTSQKTMRDYDRAPYADPHGNGTIWAAGLWDLRGRLSAAEGPGGGRLADLIVLRALGLIGRISEESRGATCRARARFSTGLGALVQADGALTGGAWRGTILAVMAARAIRLRQGAEVKP